MLVECSAACIHSKLHFLVHLTSPLTPSLVGAAQTSEQRTFLIGKYFCIRTKEMSPVFFLS